MYFSKDSFAVVFVWNDRHDLATNTKADDIHLPYEQIENQLSADLQYCVRNEIKHYHLFLDKAKEYVDVSSLKDNYLLFRSGNAKKLMTAKTVVKKHLGGDAKFVIKDTVYNWPKHLKNKSYTNNDVDNVEFVNNDNINTVKVSYPTTAYETPFYYSGSRQWTRVSNKNELVEALKKFNGTVIVDNRTGAGKHDETTVHRCFVSAFNVATISSNQQGDKPSKAVVDFAMDFAHDHKRVYPNTYVLDLYEVDGKVSVAGLVDFETATRQNENSVEKIYQFLVD